MTLDYPKATGTANLGYSHSDACGVQRKQGGNFEMRNLHTEVSQEYDQLGARASQPQSPRMQLSMVVQVQVEQGQSLVSSMHAALATANCTPYDRRGVPKDSKL